MSAITDLEEWTVGHPSQNKSFVATVVIASLLITAFFVGCGFMLYYWIRSWRGKDNYKPSVSSSSSTNEKVEDLEAQRQRPGTPPPERTYESDDESPIVEVSKWRQETVSVDNSSSQASSTRSSSELSLNGDVPERPRSRDFHELYPSN
ncbi:hypothetical protein DFP73DRAFT_594355 [Morchella snyderi]|nr:hypothetical protein DFP73DRAFT_594355 [Morchella snyderi]